MNNSSKNRPLSGRIFSTLGRRGLLPAVSLAIGCSAASSGDNTQDSSAPPGAGGTSSSAAGGTTNGNPFPSSGAPNSAGASSFNPAPGGMPGAGGESSGSPGAGGFTAAGGRGNPGGGFNPTGSAGGFGNVGGAPFSSGGSPETGAGGLGLPPGVGGMMPDPGGPPISGTGSCQASSAPSVPGGNYAANGPLPTKVVNNTGPDGQYTIYTPTTLGANGNRHPIATWGNGITTNPSFYPQLLGGVASHGFVVIASNSAAVNTQLMLAGLDWMIAQNDAAGEYQGKLNTTCLVTFGYSLGGGASVGAGAHANVIATASMHGVTGAANTLHAPLLLLTSETDTFVTPVGFVTPTYNLATVQTFYGTLSRAGDPTNLGHLIPVDGGLSLITPPEANLSERAAVIAWLRLWVYNDEGAKKYFYGDDCTLCKAPWTNPQRKNWK